MKKLCKQHCPNRSGFPLSKTLVKGLGTDWDLKALRGCTNKIGKLVTDLKIISFEAKEIWKLKIDVSDQREQYANFEDVNEFLIGRIQKRL